MTFKDIIEAKNSKDAIRNLEKILKKDGQIEIIDDRKLWVLIDDIVDGIGYGLDQFDNDIEIDLARDDYRLA